MKSKLQQQSYLVIGVFATVAIGYLFFAFLPGMRRIAQIRGEIREKQDFVSRTEKRRPLITQQQKLQQSVLAAIATQRERLVKPDEVSQLFGQISTLTQATGTRTTRFQPHEAVGYDTFHQIPIELGVTGSTESVAELIRQIETSPHTIWIQGLKLGTTGETGGVTRCDLEMEVFVDNREISD